jgi:uncharacterized protein YbbC (DUF1343 family)
MQLLNVLSHYLMSILSGADRLAADPHLLGNVRRAALVTNDAARLAGQPALHARSALLAAGVPITRLFSPEHGLSARATDGAVVADGTDARTGLPVVSLYGDTLAPPRDSLDDLDCVLFDVPDVGARFYTYTWTLTHVIDACAAAQVPVVVLDRPNPLGGLLEHAEGPILDARHASFIGRHTIPVRHSLTLGELALLWRVERSSAADVRVIECAGWRRARLDYDGAMVFVAPSPALTTFEACLLYPGLCCFEATNLSVGRGDALSFRAVGAPWLAAALVAQRCNARRLPGVRLEPASIEPATGPHAGAVMPAVRVIAEVPEKVRPVAAGLALLADIIALHPRDFAWLPYPTAANPTGAAHFERVVGVSGIREQLMTAAGSVDAATLRAWTAVPGWAERWRQVQLYE